MRTIGRYVVLREFAGEGAAEIFLARDPNPPGFEVVIKILKSNASPELARLFADEIRIGRQLLHPNIVETIDAGEHDYRPFLVMAHLEGVSLDTVRGVPLDEPTVVAIALGVARGLHAAHSLGLIHRDIKPGNVFITTDGHVKVIDFGIATFDFETHRTRSGVVRGTMSYLSPEQARGERVDARSDLFAVGILMHELLTGRSLFLRDTRGATTRAILDGPIPPPVTEDSRPPSPALVGIVMRCLTRRLALRFQTAVALENALMAVESPTDLRRVISKAQPEQDHGAEVPVKAVMSAWDAAIAKIDPNT